MHVDSRTLIRFEGAIDDHKYMVYVVTSDSLLEDLYMRLQIVRRTLT